MSSSINQTPEETLKDPASGGLPVWYQLNGEACAGLLEVDPSQGLTSAEAVQRLQKYGPNRLAETKKEPRWQAFLRQYEDFMQIILLGAAVISFFIGDTSSAIVLVILTILNAVLGLRQEAKAEESLATLRKMMRIQARVRRDGHVVEIPAEEVVPGDIVLFEAGDRVPADGRLLLTATLEIEEAALTGESTPVAKDITPVEGVDVPLGDRTNMAYMQSSVTRGRGEMLVTATGMSTEVGHIADMLQATKVQKTPLTKQLDNLTLIIAALAGLALVLIVMIGLVAGDTLQELFTVGVALAIAAIPTGLPVVVTTLLALGTMELAQRHAIVKRLPSVETLGATSAICSDKTGTLTLNQMTARMLVIAEHRYTITGEGYSPNGQIRHVGGFDERSLDSVLLPMALCSDAVIQDEELVGDPTEGALVVLAQKGGIAVRATRQEYPRIAEVPFDSAYKLMATFHHMVNEAGEAVVRCYVKGAPDVLISRAAYVRGKEGQPITVNDPVRQRLLEANEHLASEGLRVLVVAQRDFDPQTFDPAGDLLSQVTELTLLAMVGIVDLPRPEAKAAIADCKRAGIQVRMITGDHASTAAAIGRELGIKGRAITGAEFAQMSDEAVAKEVDHIGVIARVAPEHKVRLVRALQARGNIVAMTGDGVNDAPALKAANIGVAMGITGTEVSKEAAEMILTDDNFATIVAAIERGRIIYDNLMKYIRFQMAVLVGFILAFVGSALFRVAGTALFNPLQILWVNFLIDAPISIALGRDTATPGLMQRKPRPANENIITPRLAMRLTLTGIFMALITLLVYQWAQHTYGSATIAQTMALITFSMSHLFVALNLRYPYTTIFRMETLSNLGLLYAYGFVIAIIILVTEIPLLQKIFNTTSLTTQQWTVCLLVAVTTLVGAEIFKLIRGLIVKTE